MSRRKNLILPAEVDVPKLPKRRADEVKTQHGIELPSDEKMFVRKTKAYPFVYETLSVNDAELAFRFSKHPKHTKKINLAVLHALYFHVEWLSYTDDPPRLENDEWLQRITIKKFGCVSNFETQLAVAEMANVSPATVERTVAALKAMRIIIQVGEGFVVFSPLLIWRGEDYVRKALIDRMLRDGSIDNEVSERIAVRFPNAP
jgi:hypothetical protein